MLRPLTDHLVHIRLGLVLSKSGGMWPPMTMSSKLGFLNWFGNGQQFYSWIHLEDVAQAIGFILQQNNPSKLYNLTSPNPVSQKEIIQIASKVFPSVFLSFGIPAFLVRLVPFGMSELVLTDSKIIPINLLSQNYNFKYSYIQECIQELISKN